MKKIIILIFVLMLAFGIASCNNDNDTLGKTATPVTTESTPSPSVTEAATDTPDTPVPTGTPSPTPVPTQTPTQTPTPLPTPTPSPKPTPVPTQKPTPEPTPSGKAYNNQITDASLSYGGIDDLGRVLSLEGQVRDKRSDRYVGIFYFLWIGAHGTSGPYDNTKIVATYPDALTNEARWGPQGAHHFWGEPLFGYYRSNDTWVMRKHVQMLTDADVDFLVFDTTNATGGPSSGNFYSNGGNNNTYISAALDMLKILDEYYRKGFDVPKIAFYTNSNSGNAMTVIYNEVYQAHPEYAHLWFNWDGKPMIVGISSEAAKEVKDFFRIKESQWPNTSKKADGFPWMEFTRLLTNNAVYGLNGRKL